MNNPTDRDYSTPEEMEAVKAASDADDKIDREVEQRRYKRAVDYLDDGKWTINQQFIWKRSYEGQKLTYLIRSDRYNLTDPHKITSSGYWSRKAFVKLFVIAHETIDGFGENELDKLQKSRVPRKGSESYAPREILYLQKLNPTNLSSREQRWNENEVPPLEVLQQLVKWDDYLQILVKVNPERNTTEFVFEDNFVELNGEMYAQWRVKSMLLFGNQEGYADKTQWKTLLRQHPVSTTPLPVPSLEPEVEHPIKIIPTNRAVIYNSSTSYRKFKATQRAREFYLRKKQEQAGMTKEEKEADNAARSDRSEKRALAMLRDLKKLVDKGNGP